MNIQNQYNEYPIPNLVFLYEDVHLDSLSSIFLFHDEFVIVIPFLKEDNQEHK